MNPDPTKPLIRCLGDGMISKANGKRTIPQIFFNDQHVGGYDDVRALEKSGELKDLIK